MWKKGILCLLLMLLVGFSINYYFAAPPSGMTAQETVAYYFQMVNRKNVSKSNSVLCPSERSEDSYEMGGLNDYRLLDCREVTDLEELEEAREYMRELGEEPYDVALLYVSFYVNYDPDAFGCGLENGVYDDYAYYLIKETEKSDWRIRTWGYG